jgi:hypothetical protein
VYISALLLGVIGVVLVWWWSTAKQHAVHTAVAITSEVHLQTVQRALEPFQEIVAAAWLEASRWRSQLEDEGIEPKVDPTLNAFAFRAAERFARATGQANAVGAQATVHELLADMLDSELEHIQALAPDHEFVRNTPRSESVKLSVPAHTVANVAAPAQPQPQPLRQPTEKVLPTQVDLELADKVILSLGLQLPNEILRAARERHYAGNLGEAKYLYSVLVQRHPEAAEAAPASMQLKNLYPLHRPRSFASVGVMAAWMRDGSRAISSPTPARAAAGS